MGVESLDCSFFLYGAGNEREGHSKADCWKELTLIYNALQLEITIVVYGNSEMQNAVTPCWYQ